MQSHDRKQITVTDYIGLVMNFETVTSILSQIQTLVKVTLLQNRAFVPVGKPLLSRFPNRDYQGGLGQATGTKGAIWSRLVTPIGTKGSASAEVAGTPFIVFRFDVQLEEI